MEEVLREKLEGRKEGISELYFLLHLFSAKLEVSFFRLKEKQRSLSLVTAEDEDWDFPLRKEEAAKKTS